MTLTLSDCKSAALYEEINALVIEYLELNGLDKTIAAFSSECRQRSLPGPFHNTDDTKAAFSYYEGEKLLKSFDEGNLDIFVKLWKSFQSHVQVTSDDMKKLEVYLRVHFALWPCAHGEPDGVQTQAMNHLKVFFEEQSCQLSHDAAILPLFALPYVSDPKNHPIFRDLFQPTWSQRLRAQLEATLLKYYDLLQQNLGVHSKLAAIVLTSRSKDDNLNFRDKLETPLTTTVNTDTNTVTPTPAPNFYRERFFQLVKTYRQVRKLLKNTRESYGKLLKIANELIIGLESAVGGQKFNFEPIMKKCYEIFPELFTPVDPEGVIGQPNKEYFKRLAHNAHTAQFDNIIDSDVSLFFIGLADVSPDNLDYEKVKSVLVHEDTNNADKLCLLQALRWLLTKSTPKCRQTAINAFIEADIFGLSADDDEYRSKTFECMMSQNPTYLKECFARLLNTFASMKCGRAYMGNNTHCVDLLVKSLHTFKGLNESYICQMVIATLQKMSLRKQMRLEMIDRKVIQWLVKYLKTEFARTENSGNGNETKYYNPYLMEYAWALLMNLCLHEESRAATSSIAGDIVSCVTQMLISKPSREVYPYVISTLYSLLRNPEIFTTAKKMGIQSLFASCQNVEDNEMSHHFNHVTAILQAEGFDRVNTTTGEVDYDDDDDIDPTDFEPELEVSEAWEESLSDINCTGDDLLMRKYLISNSDTSNENTPPQISSPTFSNNPPTNHSPKPQQRPQGGLIVRPTTPKANKYDRLLDIQSMPGTPHSNNSTLDEDTLEPSIGSPSLSPRIKIYELSKFSESPTSERAYQDANPCMPSPGCNSKLQRNNPSSSNNCITVLSTKPERHRILPERTALVTVNDRSSLSETPKHNQSQQIPKLLSSPHHTKADGPPLSSNSGKHHKNPPAKRKTSRLLEKKRPNDDRSAEHRHVAKHTTQPG